MSNPYQEGESWRTGSDAKKQNMLAYLEWVLDPDKFPRLKKEFASQLGVAVSTLYNYENDPWFQKELTARVKNVFKSTKLVDVLNTLYERATDRDDKSGVAAARLLLEWSDKLYTPADEMPEFDIDDIRVLVEKYNSLKADDRAESETS